MDTSSRVAWRVATPEGLGAALADFRRQQGLTQAEVADACGLYRPYLSDLERGDAVRQLDRLLRVVRFLGLELEVKRAARRE